MVILIVLGGIFIIGMIAFSVLLAPNRLSNFFKSHDYRYTLQNNSSEAMTIITLDYQDYGDPNGLFISPAWTIEANSAMRNYLSNCVYIVNDRNEEIRSFELNEDIREWIKIEEGEQRILDISRDNEPCEQRLSDIEFCRLNSQLVDREMCFKQ